MLKNKREQKNGSYTEHYRQFYQGVEVEGGIFILHFKDGNLVKANGHYINTKGIDPFPKLTPEDAAQSYAAYLKISNTSSLQFLHGLVIAETETVSGTDTVYNADLCYKIGLLDTPGSNGETGYVDAHTGEILKTQRNWFNSSATDTFATMYSGTKYAGIQYYNGVYNLIDSSRNAVINTWDMNNAHFDTYATNKVEFTDTNMDWTQQEHSANFDQMALDIHWALQEIYDYFDEEHGLQSYNDDDSTINAFVHCYLPADEGWTKDNAMYISFENGDQAFFFADGQDTFKPMVALDVVAHEYAHAITNNFTYLVNDGGVQSTLNEGLSDIWGAVLENAIDPEDSEKDHWKIGEQVIKVVGDDCLRNIQIPESPFSFTQTADTYEDDVYTGGTFYAKSGVLSHWFYLLSEGGDAYNHNNDYYNVYGLGIDVAIEVVFDGQTTEFASIASYTDARDAMIDAAEDVFGSNSFQGLQVEEAWYAVGVGTEPAQPTISGPDAACYGGTTFTANNCPTGSSISWTTSSNLEVLSGGSTATSTIGTVNQNVSEEGWIQINFTSNGYIASGPRKTVWAGKPHDLEEIYSESGEAGYVGWYIPLWVTPYNSGDSVVWGAYPVPKELTDLGYGYTSIYFDEPGYYDIWAYTTNECQDGNYVYILDFPVYEYLMSPNPASNEVEITVIDGQSENSQSMKLERQGYTVTIADINGIPKSQCKYSGKRFTISVNNLKDGSYFVKINNGKTLVTKQLIIKHQ